MAVAEPIPLAEKSRVRFSPQGTGFQSALKKRIDAYFDDNGIARTANAAMFAKSAFWIGSAIAAWSVAVLGVSWGLPVFVSVLFYLVLGFTMAAIGFNVGHDAIHGATSEKPWVNRLFSWSFDAIGASSYTWSVAHNVVHHTYTNIVNVDHDLEPGPWMRFHDDTPRRWFHRWQHIFEWPLYCLTTVVWMFKKDFVQAFARDPRSGKRPPAWAVASVFAAKACHVTLFMVLPALFSPLSAGMLVLGYFLMHAAAGFTLAVVFQMAHVVEELDMPSAPSDGRMSDSWADHQMRTTANFARGDWLAQFICGGLNHQVEHHLYPRICHIHYPAIAPIVRQTALEHGLPYHEYPTFMAAVASHTRLMKRLGTAPRRQEPSQPAPLLQQAA